VEAILEGRDNSKIAAAAAQSPQKLRVLLFAGPDVTAIGGDHIGSDQIVAGQPKSPRQPAVAAAERETRYTRI
jgi:hypothetical protein